MARKMKETKKTVSKEISLEKSASTSIICFESPFPSPAFFFSNYDERKVLHFHGGKTGHVENLEE